MAELRALIWKEWRETRLFLGISWALFIGLPLIGALQLMASGRTRFEFLATPWVMGGGLILAVVVGVAGTTRDLRPQLEDFWQSRPLGALRLFVVKFLVGAAVLLLACVVPLLIEKFTSRDADHDGALMFWISVQAVAIFAIAFAAGCVLRRPANAAAVAVVGALLMYCLPIVLPPLQRFSAGSILDMSWEQLWKHDSIAKWPLANFVLGAGTLTAAMLVVGLLAVRRHWQIDSTRPLLYGAVSTAFLVLLGSASYQLGTNLPVLDSVDLGPAGWIQGFELNGPTVTVLWSRWTGNESRWESSVRTLEITGDRLRVLDPRPTTRPFLFQVPNIHQVRSERDPSVWYTVGSDDEEGFITTLSVSRGTADPGERKDQIELWRSASKSYQLGGLYLSHDRLYVVGPRVIVFDISDPVHPRKLSDEPNVVFGWGIPRPAGTVVALPPAPGLSPSERLAFAMRFYLGSAFDGSTWCRVTNENRDLQLEQLELVSLTEDQAIFKPAAVHRPTIIASIIGSTNFLTLKIHGDYLYALSDSSQLSVFNLRGPQPLRMVAHFGSAATVSMIEVLDDGRAIAAGSKVYLLGAPPR